MASYADYLTALQFVIGDPYGPPGGEEGGYNPEDPSYRGVVQSTYDTYRASKGQLPQDVRQISGDELVDLYETLYWNKAGCPALAMPLAQVVFNAAVNMGTGVAAQLLADSAGDVNQYLALQAQRYAAIAEANPAKAADLGAWLARLEHLAAAIGPVGASGAVVVLLAVAVGLWAWKRKHP